MKPSHFFLILTVSSLLTGCSLVMGERVDFGQSFPYRKYRGKAYCITNEEDARLVKKLKYTIINGDLADRAIAESQLDRVLDAYHSGIRGWF